VGTQIMTKIQQVTPKKLINDSDYLYGPIYGCGPKKLVDKIRVLPKKINGETVLLTPDANCDN
jgi:hypothetical protein